jgi:hypothetical protein
MHIPRNGFSEEIIACSCGWKNDISSRFYRKCDWNYRRFKIIGKKTICFEQKNKKKVKM